MGRLKRTRLQDGYILLDVLVAVFIALVGFAVVLGGMSLTWSLAARQNARVQSTIQQRNADAKDHSVVSWKE